MSSKEQKTPEGQAPEEIIMDQHEEIEARTVRVTLQTTRKHVENKENINGRNYFS